MTETQRYGDSVFVGCATCGPTIAEKDAEIERLQAALATPEVYAGVVTEACEKHWAELIQKANAELAAERERCRREEVEPLWQACGIVFEKVHSLSQIIDVPQHLKQAIDEVLIAADGMIETRARVGRVQAGTPLAAVRKIQMYGITWLTR